MTSKTKKTLWLLLTGFLFLLFTLNFGSCNRSSEGIPFDFNEISCSIMVRAPSENSTYSDSDIVVNVTLHIGGHEYEPNTRYTPYQNISCVYSLDGSEWQNMTFVSAFKGESFASPVNKFWYLNTWVNYTTTLRDLTDGSHYLKIDVKPDGIRSRDSGNVQEKPLIYFNVIGRHSTKPPTQLESIPVVGVIIVLTFTVASTVYVIKGKNSNGLLGKNKRCIS